jgi:Amt family ammonium transporter
VSAKVGLFPLPEYGFLPRVAFNVLLSAAAGATASLTFCHFRYGKPDVHLTYAGMIGALVAISAGADVRYTWMAVTIGAVAGVLVPVAMLVVDVFYKIDDPTGAATVHSVGAIWGLLAAGIFGDAYGFSGKLKLMLWQVLGTVAVAAFSVVCATALFLVLRRVTLIRAREADEYDGLDLAEHDIGAYPDFQQTMIKSYHLREA